MLEIAGVEQAKRQLRDLDKMASTIGRGSTSSSASDWTKGVSSSFLAANPGFQDMIARGNPPPIIPPPRIIAPPPSFMSKFGALGGGNLVGGLAITAAGFKAIGYAADALKSAFNHLEQAVQRGARLYTDAAKTGRGTGQLFQLQAALASAGIDESQANKLLLYGQFGNRAGRSAGSVTRPGMNQGGRPQMNFEGQILGAGRNVMSIGELQELKNLSGDIEKSWKDASLDAIIASQNAKSLFDMNMGMAQLKREWQTLWGELAATLSIVLIPIITTIKNDLKALNLVLDAGGLGTLIRAFGSGPGARMTQNMGSGSSRLSANSWQRMGLVMQGGTLNDAASKTAHNTGRLVQIEEMKIKGSPRGGGMPNNPNYNYP